MTTFKGLHSTMLTKIGRFALMCSSLVMLTLWQVQEEPKKWNNKEHLSNKDPGFLYLKMNQGKRMYQVYLI